MKVQKAIGCRDVRIGDAYRAAGGPAAAAQRQPLGSGFHDRTRIWQ